MRFIRYGNEMHEKPGISAGLQLSSVFNETQQDYFGTLKKVAEMGYERVETVSWSYLYLPAPELRKLLDSAGLKLISAYVSVIQLDIDLQNQLNYAQTIGARYIVIGLSKERFADEASLQSTISFLRRIGNEVKCRGMRLLYHPHGDEFLLMNGVSVVDRILSGVGTGLLQLELDLGWVTKAGLDPAATLRKYRFITPLVHVKDVDRSGNFTDVGSGVIDWASVFPVMKEIGVQHYFVEVENSPHPLESVKNSIDYLKSIGVAG